MTDTLREFGIGYAAIETARALVGWACVALAATGYWSFFAPLVDAPALAWYRVVLDPIVVPTAGQMYLLDASAVIAATAAAAVAVWIR